MIKTINDNDFEIKPEDFKLNYQENLTKRLDSISTIFDQNIINEIVLWKVNRYAELSEESISLINSISTTSDKINVELTRQVLRKLINEQGIQLPMASTILRFKNPKIYQIIDQRAYRFLYPGKTLKLSTYKSKDNIGNQIDKYLNYLTDLRNAVELRDIPFEEADRVLYNLDKRINKQERLINYGITKTD